MERKGKNRKGCKGDEIRIMEREGQRVSVIVERDGGEGQWVSGIEEGDSGEGQWVSGEGEYEENNK